MNENNNFNSKKIIEEIDKLENDAESKNAKMKKNMSKFFEKAILTVLIISAVFVVGAQFVDDIITDMEDYTEDDYSLDYYEEPYTDTVEIIDETNTTTTEEIPSNTMTIEEFMNSELKNTLLTEIVQDNTTVENETTNIENTVEEIPVIEETSTEEVEVTVEEYDEEAALKQKFEEEKKKFVITDEGKTINGELIVGIENKNNEFVYELAVYTVFYKSKEIVSIDMQTVDIVLANNKKYIKILETPEEYDSYNVFVSKYDYSENLYELQNDNVTYESYVENELIEIEIHNSGSKIDKVNFTILYYDKDGKILDVDEVSDYSINKYWPGDATGYGVWDEANKKYVEYDNYKIILDYAGSYAY